MPNIELFIYLFFLPFLWVFSAAGSRPPTFSKRNEPRELGPLRLKPQNGV